MLLCFFDIADRGELAALDRGQPATLDGTYGSFGYTKGVPVIKLYDCSIVD